MTKMKIAWVGAVIAAMAISACTDDNGHANQMLCEHIDCGGYGYCVVIENTAVCQCWPGYRNAPDSTLVCEWNELLPNVCAGIDCSGHGQCIKKDSTASCQCFPGYTNSADNPLVCKKDSEQSYLCANVDCGGHGRCIIASDGNASCLCVKGYHNASADPLFCEKDDPSSYPCANINCGGHGRCIAASDGSVSCLCVKGYHNAVDNPLVCENDVPLPISCENVDCGGHGECIVAPDDSLLCQCDLGYENAADNPLICKKDGPLPNACDNVDCGGHGECIVAPDDSLLCQCDLGYENAEDNPLVCEPRTPVEVCDDTADNNHNYMRDCAEIAPDQGKDCSQTHHAGCTQFCDSFLYNQCSTQCQTDSQCISDDYFCRSDGRCAPKVFETLWKVDSNQTKVYFPGGNGKCDYTIDWGDGKSEQYTECAEIREHTYVKSGTYSIKVTGTLEGWKCMAEYTLDEAFCKSYCSSAAPGDGDCVELCSKYPHYACEMTFSEDYHPDKRYIYPKAYLIEVKSFGPIGLDDCKLKITSDGWESWPGCGVFQNADKLQKVSEIDIPNLKGFQNMHMMFFSASEFNSDINRWDTSDVVRMVSVFAYTDKFNSPLNNWNTSNVINMGIMFRHTGRFNQPIGNWDTSKVRDMNYMFEQASVFNQPLHTWNTSELEDASYMFYGAYQFNQSLVNWDVTKLAKSRWYTQMLYQTGISRANWNDMINNNAGWAKLDKDTLGIPY